jgi:hypothetical protein
MLTELNNSKEPSDSLEEKTSVGEHIQPVAFTEEALDSTQEKKLWRKLDMIIVPILGVIFLLSFLVRNLPLGSLWFSNLDCIRTALMSAMLGLLAYKKILGCPTSSIVWR